MCDLTAGNMPRPPRLPGVRWTRKTRKATGKVYFLLYHRKTNTPLPSDWTAPKFAKALAAAGRARPKPRYVRHLVRAYEKSPEWTQLAPSTKAVERHSLETILKDFGNMPLSLVEEMGSRRAFTDWHNKLGEERGLRAADARLGRLQTIFKFGCDQEMLKRNPIATFRRLYRVDRSMVIWQPAHFEQFNAVASVEMQLAAFLALHTAQRRGDLLALLWGQYDGAGISILQSKTKQRVYIPATKVLRETLDSLLKRRIAQNGGRPVHNHHVLLSACGAPYTTSGFYQTWHRDFEASGIGPVIVDGKEFALHFHDIRGTTVTMLAESGATVPQIASITGHRLESVHRILERYLGRSKTLAGSAIAKFELTLIAG